MSIDSEPLSTHDDNIMTLYEKSQQQNPIEDLTLRIVSWNASGLSGKLEELLEVMIHDRIAIALIQETWLLDNRTIHPTMTLSCSEVSPAQKITRAHYGMGIVIHPYFINSSTPNSLYLVDSVDTSNNPGSPSYIQITLLNSIKISCVYLSPLKSTEDCLQQLSELAGSDEETRLGKVDGSPHYIIGDFNMRLGSLVGDHDSNARGKAIHSYMNSIGFHLLLPDNSGVTFSNDLGASVIDFCYTNTFHEESRICIKDMDSLGSDHFPLQLSIPLDSATSRLTVLKRDKRWRLKELRKPETQIRYKQCVQELMTPLQEQFGQHLFSKEDSEEVDIDSLYNDIIDSIKKAAKITIGQQIIRHKTARNWFITQEARRLIHERRKAYNKWRYTHTNHPLRGELYRTYLTLRLKCKNLVDEEKRRIFHTWADNLTTLPKEEVSKMMRCIANKRKRACVGSLKTDDISISRYTDFYKSMYTPNPRKYGPFLVKPVMMMMKTSHVVRQKKLPDLFTCQKSKTYNERANESLKTFFSISDMNHLSIFDAEIIEKVLMNLPKGKAPGASGLPNELLSAAASSLAPILSYFFCIVYLNGMCPLSWSRAIIHPIFKKGDNLDIRNYRPISLTESLRKVFERCLQPLINAYLEPLCKTQNGFRNKRSTIDHVAFLQECLTNTSNASDFYVAFLDIKSAYDKVDREILWQKLSRKGLPDITIRILSQLFDFNTSQLRIQKTLSEPFELKCGLFQGSILSPILYSAFIDDLAEILQRSKSVTFGNQMMGIDANSLFYADDICVMTNTADEMQALLDLCENHANENNYTFNVTKSEFLFKYGKGRSDYEPPPFRLHGDLLKPVSSFTYLGIPFGSKGIQVDTLIQTLSNKITKLLGIFNRIGYNAYGLQYSSSIFLYRTHIRPILEYCLSILPLNKQQTVALERLQQQCLSRMFSIGMKTDHMALNLLTGLPTMATRKLILSGKWIQHLDCMSSDYLLSDMWQNIQWRTQTRKRIKKKSSFYNYNNNEAFNRFKVLYEKDDDLIIPDPNHVTNDNILTLNSNVSTTEDRLPIRRLQQTCKVLLSFKYSLKQKKTDIIWKKVAKEIHQSSMKAGLNERTTISRDNMKKIGIDGSKMADILCSPILLTRELRRMAHLYLLEKLPGKPKKCIQHPDTIATKAHMLHCCDIQDRLKRYFPKCMNLIELLKPVEDKLTQIFRYYLFLHLTASMSSHCLGISYTIPPLTGTFIQQLLPKEQQRQFKPDQIYMLHDLIWTKKRCPPLMITKCPETSIMVNLPRPKMDTTILIEQQLSSMIHERLGLTTSKWMQEETNDRQIWTKRRASTGSIKYVQKRHYQEVLPKTQDDMSILIIKMNSLQRHVSALELMRNDSFHKTRQKSTRYDNAPHVQNNDLLTTDTFLDATNDSNSNHTELYKFTVT